MVIPGSLHPLSWVAGMHRNGWPDKFGMGGRFALEWVAGMARNTHSLFSPQLILH